MVEPLQERDRLEVLAPAMLVGQPVARLARVVEVEHGGDRIHAQAVEVQVLDPILRRGDQEVLHLASAVIEDQGAPVAMLAAARVFVFVEGTAVEAGEGEVVAGEVGRHPVKDHADAGGMGAVDEAAECLGRAEAAAGREVAGGLVAPGAVEGVFGNRQQFDMGEAPFQDVGDQRIGQLVVAQERVVVTAPGAQVDLVDGDRRLIPVPLFAALDPVVILPVEGAEGRHDGRGIRAFLERSPDRIGA